jgi:hypothetical protein
VTPPPDGTPLVVFAHEACFATLRDPSVDYDDPKDHGRIPGKARCVFCGDPLPIVGTHPYVLEAGGFSPPHRCWAHAPCLLERLVRSLAEQLKISGAPGLTEGGESA